MAIIGGAMAAWVARTLRGDILPADEQGFAFSLPDIDGLD